MARLAAIGEKPKVAHPHEARGQHMQQEAPQEFLPGQGHDLTPVAVAVILIAQVHRFPIETQQAAIGAGNAMAERPRSSTTVSVRARQGLE